MKGESTLFRQTLVVLVGALILAHLVSFFAFMLLPPREARAVTLSGVASQLADPACDSAIPEMAQARNLELSCSPGPPVLPDSMRTDPTLHAQLARVLGVPDTAIRLGFAEGSEI